MEFTFYCNLSIFVQAEDGSDSDPVPVDKPDKQADKQTKQTSQGGKQAERTDAQTAQMKKTALPNQKEIFPKPDVSYELI